MAWLALTVFLCLGGCSTYSNQAARVRASLVEGNTAEAMKILEKDGGKEPDVLNHLERGLLLYDEGRFQEAIEAFDQAEVQIDDLYTKSVTREAAAFLTNDATLPYTGYPAEQVLLHVYAALSYLGLGDRQGALVETRKVSERLEQLESVREDAQGYTDDPFVEWIAAMLYADDRDANACLVSCRRALEAFEEQHELWGMPLPEDFLLDYLRWSERFGFSDEGAVLREKFPSLADVNPHPRRDEGEVILIYGSGFVDALAEVRADFPILKTDRGDEDERVARRVYRRGRRGYYVVENDVEIAYWLSVAFPVLSEQPYQLASARLRSEDQVDESELAADLSAVFQLTFEEGQTGRMVRTITRALVKYAAVQAAKATQEKETGKQVAGFLANLFTAATERADTRSWTVLPDRLHLARLRLPTGQHEVTVEILDRSGHVAQTATFSEVRVYPGEHTFLHHRSFR